MRLLCASLVKAVAAVYRTIVLRLERNLRFLAAVCADDLVHLALLTALTAAAALIAAVTAAYRLILETLLRIKFLFSCTKDKILTTVLAY